MQVRKRQVLFLLPYPLGVAPSQRFRVEAYFPAMEAEGIEWRCATFLDNAGWKILYRKGAVRLKAWAIVKGFLKRLWTVFLVSPHYRYVFIHREAAPLGPPVFEWILARIMRKKIIYDFDDAIWIPAESTANKLATGFKAFWKIGSICSWAHTVVGGNKYLSDFGKKHVHTGQVVTIPTVVDTTHRYNQLKAQHEQPVTVGWTGSHSTLPYLDAIMPSINRLQEEFDFKFLVIADKKPELPLRNWEFIPWNRTTEIGDLLRLNIGVMPLTADPWSEGKCGFKLIQYLSLGIPAVASPVGVNTDIVDSGRNGYIAGNAADWEIYLKQLLVDARARTTMGIEGRETIEARYSLNAYKAAFLSLFR